ncbi:MerR family transcriptional regulator [Nocardia sp. NBC_00881]|uniref:DNA polymerase III subunit beta family protein n=1 Tax=Nocardia sp. NBC_00881 TaxID=2975995 RepID=UPI00386C30A0|nr:MerR family transcriptional regulator [Nocardia sp. NBC_00881]
MTSSEFEGLITIGVLARASGLTASALRFYDDCGLLIPARVDPITGYRYYREAQRERAALIRQLRAIDLPLETIARILSGAPAVARQLLDHHVDDLARRAREAARIVAAVKESLEMSPHVAVSATALAEALEQVRAAAARTREIPVLAGVLVEAGANALTLTATDRYRLSTRTLVPHRQHGCAWSLVLDPKGLAAVTAWLRDVDEIVATPTEHALILAGDGAEHHSAVIAEPFPDHRAVLSALGPVRTRVVVARQSLLEMLEKAEATVQLAIDQTGITVSDSSHLPASVTGSPITLSFDPATLLAAVHTALGPDLMLDIAATDRPVVLRSATDGDLTTLAMPTRPATTPDENT